MSTRTKGITVLPNLHTAGIFGDSTVDGPEIGTLVLVVDRAKNLPNRKTIGKQDPYCAARLGKEAKRTNTDIRGGQTPKWDQELRFVVHDSSDYYQLKISVFNDDKKTELIGETWINLRDIIVVGGGQSDQWHGLQSRGKYAGEVRLEITYYDSRARAEKPSVKARVQDAQPEQPETAAPVTTVGPRQMPKRRPLPSDPVTGKASPAPIPSPASAPIPAPPPQQIEAPPPVRAHSNPVNSYIPSQSPLQQLEYGTQPPPQSTRYQQQPDHYPRREPSTDRRAEEPIQQQYRTADSQQPHHYPRREPSTDRRAELPPQQYRTPERGERYMQQADDRGYSTHQAQLPPAQQPIYDRYDSRPQDNYGAPPPPPPQREDSGGFEDDRPPPPPAHRSRTGSNPAVYQQNMQTMRQDVLRNEAHRASASPASSSAAYPGRPTYKAADSAPGGLASAQYSIEQPPPPLHYSYDAGYDQSHRGMQATVEDVPESPESMNSYRRSIGGRQSLGQSQQQFDMDFAPTDSPAPLNIATRRGSNAGPAPEQSRYSTSPGMQDQPGYQASNGVYSTSPSQAAVQREPSEYSHHSNYGRHSEPTLPSYDSQRDQRDQRALTYRNEFEDTSNNYAAPPPPPVPAALVPGINPNVSQMSQELVRFGDDRSHHQRRYTQPAHNEVQPRGRTMDLSRRYDYDDTTANYNAPPPPVQHAKTYTNGMPRSDYNVVVRTRGQSPIPPPARDPSPNPPQQQHTIRRKSVSPRPPSSDSRAMSSVPFGPDSYDSLNPSVAAASNDLPDYDAATGKIITHDGREVDPSDHLPMDTWAPEPEPKKPTPAASPSGRPAPAGPQPLPPSGRRQLRIAARPQSMLPGTPNGGYSSADPYDTPSPPVSTGRNRLQKKPPPRTSTSALPAGVPMMSGANGPGPDAAPAYNSGFRRNSNVGMESTPLAPLPPHQDNFNAPRQLSRASTFDYVGGENYHPSMNGQRGGPPPPAKIPLALPPAQGYGHGGHNMSGAMQLHSSSAARRGGMDDYNDPYGHGGGGGTMDYGRDLSLEEELSQIDIGTGRSSRRHRHQGHAAHASAGGGYGGGHQGQW